MKKFLVFVILYALCFQFTSAQSGFGVRMGLNYANLSQISDAFGSNFSSSHRPALHFGVFNSIQISDKFNFIPELLYSSKGYELDFNGTSIVGISLNYLSVPMYFSYDVIDKLSVKAGPEISYKLSARSKFEDQNEDVDDIYDNDVDVALNIGLSYSLTNLFTIELRYSHGFSSVIKETELFDFNGDPIDYSFENRVFQLSFGYKFQN